MLQMRICGKERVMPKKKKKEEIEQLQGMQQNKPSKQMGVLFGRMCHQG
jgi:hypothetical protein